MRSSILHQFARSIASQPAAMEPNALRDFMAAHATPPKPGEDKAYDDEDDAPQRASKKPFTLVGSVAVVEISGMLVPGMVDYPGYAKGYGAIEAGIRSALADSAVSAIVLRVNSPGGYSTGCPECADVILAARGKKPIVAFAETMAASAAYWLASAADKLYATKAAYVGSIGVWNAHVDYTKAFEDFGIKVTLVHAGARKVDGSPFRPMDDESRANLQSQVDAVYDMFASATAAHRGSTMDAMKATEARMYMGEAATKQGLADGVVSFDSLLAGLNASAAAAAIPPTTPASSGKDNKAMADLKDNPAPSLADAADAADLARLRAKEDADKIAEADRVKQAREQIFEKHGKRLAPATMAKMRESLANVDAKSCDDILSRIADQVHPTPTGAGGATPAGKQYASAQDELIERAQARTDERQKAGRPIKLRLAMVEVLREDPDLNKRVSSERAGEELPTK